MRTLEEYLATLTVEQKQALYRAAKKPGLRPFFSDPRAMITLRNSLK